MFKYKVSFHKDSDLDAEISKFSLALKAAHLAPNDSKFLLEQLESTLSQFKDHLAMNRATSLAINRVLEGSGYKITIKSNRKEKGILLKLMELFRS